MNPEFPTQPTERDKYEGASSANLAARSKLVQTQDYMDKMIEISQDTGEVVNEMINQKSADLNGDVEAAKNIVFGNNKSQRKEINERAESQRTEIDLSRCPDFASLYLKIIENNGLPSSGGPQTAEYWIQRIEDVRAGKTNLEYLTSMSGLRAKVSELMTK